MEKQYRKCAGAVVFNKNGQVFLGNRIGFKDAWQFPQGGVEENENYIEAAKRELFEETGIKSVEFVCIDEKPIRYEFTEEIKQKFRKKGIYNDGQDICFSLFYFNGNENEINLNMVSPEFSFYKWESFDFAVENIVEFKKDIYKHISEKFSPIIRQYLKINS